MPSNDDISTRPARDMDISTVVLAIFSINTVVEHACCSFTTNDSLLWPSGFVHYEFGDTMTQPMVDLVMRAMLLIQRKSCVEFIPSSELSTEPGEGLVYLHFRYVNDVSYCHNGVGRTPNHNRFDKLRQEVTLSDWCLAGEFAQSRVLQVVLQTLGFHYETQRPDRDCFIEVKNNKTTTDYPTPQLTIQWDADITFPYDYWTVMQTRHVYRTHKKLPGHKAVQVSTRQPDEPRPGTLSDMDVRKLNYLYCGATHPCVGGQRSRGPGQWTFQDQCEEELDYVIRDKCIPPRRST